MFKIETGSLQRPVVGLIYGPPGVGKTDFAAQYKRTLVLDNEDGSDFLNVSRHKSKVFKETIDVMLWASEQKEFDTIIIDSLTQLERIIVAHTVKENGWKSIEDPAYGKGWATYRANFVRILNGIEFLKKAGKNVILIGHSQVKAVNDPSQDPHDRVEYHLDQKLQPVLTSILDFCYYMRPQRRAQDAANPKDKRSLSSGARELITVDRGGVLAKNRFPHLPEIIEFQFESDPEVLAKTYAEFWDKLTTKPVKP